MGQYCLSYNITECYIIENIYLIHVWGKHMYIHISVLIDLTPISSFVFLCVVFFTIFLITVRKFVLNDSVKCSYCFIIYQ